MGICGKMELYGTDRRDALEEQLTPDYLIHELWKYQEAFGKEFGIQELLMLKDIQAKGMIAEAINDAPEFMLYHYAKRRVDIPVRETIDILDSISSSLEKIARRGGERR